jgi:hypothetical protein
VALVCEHTTPTELPLLAGELSANFLWTEGANMVVSVTDPCGPILGFLGWGRYFFFQVAPQLYSQGIRLSAGEEESINVNIILTNTVHST